MAIDIALGAVWSFISPLLSDSLKERLKPKDSPSKAKERAFCLYKCLGDVESKSAVFVAEFKKLIDVPSTARSRNEWNDPLAYAMSVLLLSLEELADALDAVNPQLDVHKHELVQMIQDFRMCRGGITLKVSWMLDDEKSLNVDDLRTKLLEAEENAKKLHSAISDFRAFLASEFSFKESF